MRNYENNSVEIESTGIPQDSVLELTREKDFTEGGPLYIAFTDLLSLRRAERFSESGTKNASEQIKTERGENEWNMSSRMVASSEAGSLRSAILQKSQTIPGYADHFALVRSSLDSVQQAEVRRVIPDESEGAIKTRMIQFEEKLCSKYLLLLG